MSELFVKRGKRNTVLYLLVKPIHLGQSGNHAKVYERSIQVLTPVMYGIHARNVLLTPLVLD